MPSQPRPAPGGATRAEAGFVALVFLFMLWVRMLPYRRFASPASVYFHDSDTYYHYREVLGAVQSFPRVPRWDPWTNFPHGTWTGQFGTPFDWVAALVALSAGGGHPTDLQVANWLSAYPAVLGALLAIPFYFLARRLLGGAGAVTATLVLAILPGPFFIRTAAGYPDHHVAEVLLLLCTLLAFLVALHHASGWTGPLLDRRQWAANRRALAWSAVAGACLALQVLTWPASIVFGALVAGWLASNLLLQRACGAAAQPSVAVGMVAFACAAAALVPFVETHGFLLYLAQLNEAHTLPYDAMLPLLCLVAAAALAAVHAVAGLLQARGRTPWLALPALAVPAVALAGLAAAVHPATASQFAKALGWITGVHLDPVLRGVVSEMAPSSFFCTRTTLDSWCMATLYGPVAPAALVALLPLAAAVVIRRRSEEVLLLAWSLLAFLATATQVRFAYYVAVNIALLMGWLATRLPKRMAAVWALGRVEGRPSQGPRPAVFRALAILIVAILLAPGSLVHAGEARPVWEAGAAGRVDPSLAMLADGMAWLRQATPDAGVDLARQSRPPPDGQPDYPQGSYGVLAWWQYGHHIEVLARRPPVSNPFQQGIDLGALFYTDRDPADADARLDAWVDGVAPIRYVMVGSKDLYSFQIMAFVAHAGDASRPAFPSSDYLANGTYRGPGGPVSLLTPQPSYRESMLARLFEDDGEGMGGYRLVWEHPNLTILSSSVDRQGKICVYLGACQVTVADPAAYQPGTLVAAGDVLAYDVRVLSPLKFFERVAGARLTGEAVPGSLINATVELLADGSGRTFVHRESAIADGNGRFAIRFPYPTTQLLRPMEGGTDAAVRAAGPVRVIGGGLDVFVDVPERAVLEGGTLAVV